MTQAHQPLSGKLSAASLLDAIGLGEGAAIEFKSSFQKEVVETLTAFANTQGGAVLMGVSDAGKIVGVSRDALVEQVQRIMDFMVKHTNKAYIITGNPRREERWDYPMDAVRRGIDSFIAYGLPEPEFESTQGGMAVTVFSAVNVGVNGLLRYIQTHLGQRAGDIVVAFKLTQRTIERWLKQHKENDQIEFRGAPKTGGYYCKNT